MVKNVYGQKDFFCLYTFLSALIQGYAHGQIRSVYSTANRQKEARKAVHSFTCRSRSIALAETVSRPTHALLLPGRV